MSHRTKKTRFSAVQIWLKSRKNQIWASFSRSWEKIQTDSRVRKNGPEPDLHNLQKKRKIQTPLEVMEVTRGCKKTLYRSSGVKPSFDWIPGNSHLWNWSEINGVLVTPRSQNWSYHRTWVIIPDVDAQNNNFSLKFPYHTFGNLVDDNRILLYKLFIY